MGSLLIPVVFYSDEEDLSTLTSYKKRLVGLYKLFPTVLQALVVCISSGVALQTECN